VTKQNTYSEPQLFIGDEEIFDFSNVKLSFSNSSLNTMSVTVSQPDLDSFKLFNRPIQFYLNCGANDGVPIFRGFIKDYNTGSKNVTIKALDPRCFMTGSQGIPIDITETDNYDGFTVAQFLQAYITDYINVNDTVIGLNALKDIEKPPLMKSVRGTINDVYGTIRGIIDEEIDDSDLTNIKKYYVDMIDDGLYSNITFYTEQNLDDNSYPSLTLKYDDGLVDYKYKRRAPPTSIIVSGTGGNEEEGGVPVVGSFNYGNSPMGRVGKAISGKYNSVADAQQAGVVDLLQNYDVIDELTVISNKGYYIGLGSIVSLQVPEVEISKNFRLVGKDISFTKNSMQLTLKLSKPKLRVSF